MHVSSFSRCLWIWKHLQKPQEKPTSKPVQILSEGPGLPRGPGLEDEATAEGPWLLAWGPESQHPEVWLPAY